MTHKSRVESHCLIDILASTVGGALVVGVLNKSSAALLLAVSFGITLLLLERKHIREEGDREFIPPTPEPVLVEMVVEKPSNSLSDKDVLVLKKTAAHPAATNVPQELLAGYIAGLEDGAAVNAQWVLAQIEEVSR